MARQNQNGVWPRARERAAQTCEQQTKATLVVGTIIYTLDGALPVEHLIPGDRVITRAGARELRAVAADENGFTLSFDGPEIIYADGVETLAA